MECQSSVSSSRVKSITEIMTTSLSWGVRVSAAELFRIGTGLPCRHILWRHSPLGRRRTGASCSLRIKHSVGEALDLLHLHLDQIADAGLVGAGDIDDGFFFAGSSPGLVGWPDFHVVHHSLPRKLKRSVDEADQGGGGVVAAEDALEGEVGFGVDKSHGMMITQDAIKSQPGG